MYMETCFSLDYFPTKMTRMDRHFLFVGKKKKSFINPYAISDAREFCISMSFKLVPNWTSMSLSSNTRTSPDEEAIGAHATRFCWANSPRGWKNLDCLFLGIGYPVVRLLNSLVLHYSKAIRIGIFQSPKQQQQQRQSIFHYYIAYRSRYRLDSKKRIIYDLNCNWLVISILFLPSSVVL